MKNFLTICFTILVGFSFHISAQVPVQVLVQISRAEDELRFDNTLEDLMESSNAKIRRRAALAAGRIGNEAAIPALTEILESDADVLTRATAAFALGEIESVKGADAILKVLANAKNSDEIRARAVEAAGKIVAGNAKDATSKIFGAAILDTLNFENNRGRQRNRKVVLLGLTAALRAKPEESNIVAAKFLTDIDARIRADAANTLSRLRAKNANEQFRAMLLSDADAIARANAARALGAAEDKEAFNLLLDAATTDEDSRVRVSAIRALGNLKDAKAADKLLIRAEVLLTDYKKSKFANPFEKNELLEIATTLGRVLPNTNNQRAIKFLDDFRNSDNYESPEIEIAFAQVSPASYLKAVPRSKNAEANFWKQGSSVSQGIAEFSKLADKGQSINPGEHPQKILLDFLNGADSPNRKTVVARAIPDILRAYATFKSSDLPGVLREHLKHKDIIVRATAAELLGEQPASELNIEALKAAFAQALQKDKDSNDAQLAILSALVKLDKTRAVFSLKLALNAPDFLVRRHAANLIKQSELSKDFPDVEKQVGTVKIYNPQTNTKLGQILNTNADYLRAVSCKNARAILTTDKGTFTIEFAPEDAPLTVDNFIKLAKLKYFDGLAIHRVVPNFVMQDGDPRGDGNGGPGWQIRDEINMLEYERGAVGMALSGKDTGGSQWFVTHSPQPHLDGGYTVFGRVNEIDMKIVDNLVRGDKILSVKIVEGNLPRKSTTLRKNK
jgi:cyclophilin family peptidyl-prolyl cis-trans isomerase/HEAT repeat protein